MSTLPPCDQPCCVEETEDGPEVLIDPEAYVKGRSRALRSLQSHVEALPESLATRTMDEGRGAAEVANRVRSFLALLAEEYGG